jgi:hypothetical protein
VDFPVHELDVSVPNLSYAGYTYLQDELAKQGIVSVSVDARLPDNLNQLVETRADLILAALDHLWAQSLTPGSVYFQRLDFSKVGMMGHSRGGDAVVRAAKKAAAATPRKYDVQAVCSLAPTDFTGGDPAANRTFLDVADAGFYLVMYGALDGDVSGLDGPAGNGGTGFRHYDRARTPKSMAFFAKCIHNSFNSVWFSDPPLDSTDGRQLDEKGHQTLALEYVGDLFRWKLKNQPRSGRFDGTIKSTTATDTSLQWLFGSSVKVFDDFEHGATNILGGAAAVKAHLPDVISVRDENQVTHDQPPQPVGILMPHQSHMLQLGWGSNPRVTGIQAYTSDVPAAHQDWSGYDTLLVSLGGYYKPDSETTIKAEWLPRVRVLLTDDAGATAVVDFSQYGVDVPSRPTWTDKGQPSTLMRFETVPIALGKFTGVDLHKVKQLSLELEPAGIVTAYVDNIHVVKR